MHFTSSDEQRVLAMLPPEDAQAAFLHAQGLEDAATVMLHRTASYGLAWQRYGALGNLVNAARKVERLMGIWYDGNQGDLPALHKDALDDAVDAINYLQFFITCARHGNLTGDRRKLPPEGPWYPIVNDLVGGWAVCNRNLPMSQLDGPQDIVIADMMNREDAEIIAGLLNK